MGLDAKTIIALVLAAVAGVVWLVRLEGRINLLDRLMSDWKVELTKTLDEIRGDVKTLLRNSK